MDCSGIEILSDVPKIAQINMWNEKSREEGAVQWMECGV